MKPAGRVPGLVGGCQDIQNPGGDHWGGIQTNLPLNEVSTCPLPSPLIQDISRIPANPAIEGIPDAIAAAARAHGAEGGVVVMVVQPGERNAYDQQVGL